MPKIPLSKPDITDAERNAVVEVLDTSVLSFGKKYRGFQDAVARFAGVKYAVATNSGTSALHLIIRALGIKKGDEVITTPFSFISSANCIVYEDAKPVFADIDAQTLNLDPAKIEAKITERTKAILAVDIFGYPADWPSLEKIARKHKLFLIEDSAEALGSEYDGRKCGSFGDAAVFAFYPNKQVTAGEGGMVLTNRKKIADFCQSAANQGRRSHRGQWLEHVRLGYNYRLDEMSGALGLAQMKRIKELLKKRRNAANAYGAKLKGIPSLQLPSEGDTHRRVSHFVYVVRLPESFAGRKRDAIMKALETRGIECRAYFQSIHLQPWYRKEFGYNWGDYPVAESISQRTIALPFFNDIKASEIAFVAKTLKKLLA